MKELNNQKQDVDLASSKITTYEKTIGSFLKSLEPTSIRSLNFQNGKKLAYTELVQISNDMLEDIVNKLEKEETTMLNQLLISYIQLQRTNNEIEREYVLTIKQKERIFKEFIKHLKTNNKKWSLF
jgi:ethanolamine utilization protein EutA (predicted chaperonin)